MTDSHSPVRALLDTSLLIAREGGRLPSDVPESAAISVVTVGELELGVLLAEDPGVRAQRLRTLTAAERLFEPLPVDLDVAHEFAALVANARKHGRRPKATDALIAATAIVHDLVVYTRDEDFAGLPGVRCVVV